MSDRKIPRRGWNTTARDEVVPVEVGEVTGFPSLNRQADQSGWPTPRQSDGTKNMRTAEGASSEIKRKGTLQDLLMAAAITGPARITVSDEVLTGFFAGIAEL